jgi:hypothetical protein
MFAPERCQLNIDHLAKLKAEDLDLAWSKWARREEMERYVITSGSEMLLTNDRATLSLTIHDVELASLAHHQPNMRSGTNTLPVSYPAEVYAATDAKEWLRVIQNHSTARRSFKALHLSMQRGEVLTFPETSMYTLYIMIVEIANMATEERVFGTLYAPESSTRFTNLLITWYRSYDALLTTGEEDPFCLSIYWHAVFIYISVDLDRLEGAIGRDKTGDSNNDAEAENVEYAKDWALSKAAKRAIVHAFFLQKELGARRLDQEPAIHVPRGVFQAALALYCYMQFGRDLDGVPSMSGEDDNVEFPEVRLMGFQPAEVIFEINGFRRQRPAPLKAVTLCALYDLLQRIGHWEIARVFAKILGLLIHGESE